MSALLSISLAGAMTAISLAWFFALRLRRELEHLRCVIPSRGRTGVDPMTGLTNRVGLAVALRVHHSRRTDLAGDMGVVVLDLAQFGQVNESLGRSAGDQVLVEVAQRLKASARAHEVVARVSGDRFIVMLDPPVTGDGVLAAANRLLDRISGVVMVNGRSPVHVRAHVGAAVGPRREATHIVEDAELAANWSRIERCARPVLFEDSMRQRADSTFNMTQQLQTALHRDELFVVYQPIHALENGRLAGLEALMRWDNPTLGLVSPNDFIPVAERTGAIVELGAWVLGRACSDLQAITDDESVSVSVNVSVHQLRRGGMPDTVIAALSDSGLSPDRLRLEVTESTLASPDEVGAQLESIRALGVRISLDDVGTGYSSFGQLANLPIDTIKLDRSLLPVKQGEDTAAHVFMGLASLGQSLGLEVVAEGIETEFQSSLATEAGCSHEQGFLRSRPLSVEAASRYAGDSVPRR